MSRTEPARLNRQCCCDTTLQRGRCCRMEHTPPRILDSRGYRWNCKEEAEGAGNASRRKHAHACMHHMLAFVRTHTFMGQNVHIHSLCTMLKMICMCKHVEAPQLYSLGMLSFPHPCASAQQIKWNTFMNTDLLKKAQKEGKLSLMDMQVVMNWKITKHTFRPLMGQVASLLGGKRGPEVQCLFLFTFHAENNCGS